jgi:hypothetical protein
MNMNDLLERTLKDSHDPSSYTTEVNVSLIGEHDELLTKKIRVEWYAVLNHKRWGIQGVDVSVINIDEVSYTTLDGQEHVIDILAESVVIGGDMKFPLGPTDLEVTIDKNNNFVSARLEF